MARRRLRTLSLPILVGTFAVPLAIAMLVAWTVVFVKSSAIDWGATWLLVLGIISLVVVVLSLVVLAVLLAREILEVERQVSFIDSVTHELKSPLSSLKLNLETLARDLSPEQDAELRRMMMTDIDRLTGFIDDILVANQVAHARTSHELGAVDVPDLAERCVARVLGRHGLEPATVALEIEPELRVVTDHTALETVLTNLVDNAVKYSEPPVQVVVRARTRENGDALLEVVDRGIGIDAKTQKRIFDRFYRAPQEEVRARHGTGLGLFVVQALVRAVGGRLGVESRGAGHGTTMQVILPARKLEGDQ